MRILPMIIPVCRFYFVLILLSLFGSVSRSDSLELPIRELVKIGSMRENQLAGYGLVVGLPQTGDTRSMLTTEQLKRVLSLKGMPAGDISFETRNVAVVMVTAKLPPLALSGNPIDIWVSSIGNARSLQRGYLLQTPLSGADGRVYAVAQGSISSSSSGTERSRPGRQKETTAFISNGAIIEQEVTQPITLNEGEQRVVYLHLIHFDISTANNVINGINQAFPGSAQLRNNGTIAVQIPEETESPGFISDVLKIPVTVESRARVVIDPRSGTIVMGGNVGLSPVAVSKSGMSIRIGDSRNSGREDKKKPSIVFLEESPTVSQLVDVLNKLGLGSREIIDILKAIHSAGALHAELLII